MRDNVAVPNLGQAGSKYDYTFFHRSFRDIELFLNQLLSAGPLSVTTLIATSLSVNGSASFSGPSSFAGTTTFTGTVDFTGATVTLPGYVQEAPIDGQYYVRRNGAWEVMPVPPEPVYIGDTAPVSPFVKQLWFKSDEGKLFIYYDDGTDQQWVQLNAV